MPSVLVLIILSLSVSMLNFNMLSISIECHYAQLCFAKCQYPEGLYDESHQTDCFNIIMSVASTSVSNDYVFTSSSSLVMYLQMFVKLTPANQL